MTRGLAAFAFAVVVALLALAHPARAAGVSGIDCECSGVGYYALPAPLVPTKHANGLTTSSPGGTYRVTTAPAPNGAFVTVKKKNSNVALIDQVEGSSWGFSPDDDRFVLYAFEAGRLYAYLYNLAGATPGTPIIPRVDVTASGIIAFSPAGLYAVVMTVNPATGSQIELAVHDAETGDLLHEDELSGYAPNVLPAELPEGQTALGALSVGFGPDGDERSLVYAWVNGNTSLVYWKLVRLDVTPALVRDGDSSHGFDWGFSPCGDRLGIVTRNTGASLKEARLYSTFDGTPVGTNVDYAITDDDFLGVDAASHFDFHGLNETPGDLGPNTANDSCSGGPSTAPAASFLVSTPRLPNQPILFTDQSTTPQGTITSRAWAFGDGTTSTATSPTHTYSASGTFVVTLTVKNSLNKTGSAQESVTVGAPAGGVLSGTDCECSRTGTYKRPESLVETDPVDGDATTSPNGKYTIVTDTSGGIPHVTVLLTSTGQPLLGPLEGSSWGFSPDQDRFVLYAFEAGIPYAYLYNLAGAQPSNDIIPRLNIVSGGLIAFSPSGRYAVTLAVHPTIASQVELAVRDAASGALVHDDTIYNYSPSLTTGLPDGQTALGSLRVGFAPNSDDRSFIYAWIDGNLTGTPAFWKLVKLDASPVKWRQSDPLKSFTWGFSPCGDRLGVVGETSVEKQTRLYSTFDHAEVGGLVTFGVADTSFLRVDATAHYVHHGLSSETLLEANTAKRSCTSGGGGPGGGGSGGSGGGAPVSPVAAFDVSAGRLTGIPIDFTDHSTTSKGTITGRFWAFGDGTYDFGPTLSHAYGSPGVYEVALKVTNSFGRQATAAQSLTITQNQPPVASFTYAPTYPNSRDVITFTSTSTDDDTILYTGWYINGVAYSGTVVQAKVCAPLTTVFLTVGDSVGQYGDATGDVVVGGTDRVNVPPGSDLEVAADAACPGDTLVLGAGTYPGGKTIRRVHIEGAGQGVSVIEGTAPGWALTLAPGYDWSNSQLETLSLSGVTVTGGQAVYDAFGRVDGGGVGVAGDGAVALDDVELAYNDGIAGFYLYNNGWESSITRSNIHHNQRAGVTFDVAQGRLTDSAIFENGTGATFAEGGAFVEGSDFYDNDGPGLDINDADGVVASSRFYGNGKTDPRFALSVSDGFTEVSGCLVAENHGGGVSIQRYVTVSSTTIAGNCGTGLKSSNGNLYDSIVFGNGLDLEGTLAADDANLVGVDPLFVGSGDYHLSLASPAIDAGDAQYLASGLDVDGDGDDRVLASSGGSALLDIGWDEWNESQPAEVLPVLGCVPGSGGSGGTGGGPGVGGSGPGTGGSGPGVGGSLSTGGTGGGAGAAGEAGSDAGATSAGGTAGASGATGSSGEGGTGNDGPVATAGEPGSGAQSGEGPNLRGGSGGRGHAAGGEGAEAGAGTPTEGGAAGETGHGAGRGGRAGGAGAAAHNPPRPRESGCGCRTASDSRGYPYSLALASLLLGFAVRRRRNRSGVVTR